MRWAGSIPACPLRTSSSAAISTPAPRRRGTHRISPSVSALACPGHHRLAGERQGLLEGIRHTPYQTPRALVTLVRRMRYGLGDGYTCTSVAEAREQKLPWKKWGLYLSPPPERDLNSR